MKFVFFSVSENRENGLGDELADWAMPPPPQNFGARTPSGLLHYCVKSFIHSFIITPHW